MTGKTILISGCSSGIGLCVAQGLQQRGYHVIASARQQDDLKHLQNQGLSCIQLDLNNSASIRAAVDQTLALTDGRLDALFNNAGFGQYGAVEDLSRDALRAQFEANVFGTHELTTQIIPIMRRQGHGRIINNSSVLGLVALPFRGAYNASKFALEGLTDTLRLELENSGIHVSLIEPGPIVSRFGPNAYKVFVDNINADSSVHSATYTKLAARLQEEGLPSRFKLGPTAVLHKVIHALESPRPKIRYYVTVPTYAMAYIRRLLPYRMMDYIVGGRR